MSSTAAASSDYDFSPGLPLLERPSRVRHARRAFTRYLIAICIGVAATLAWQSYGDTVKQAIATKAPELGWSPEVQQLITASVQELGWAKPAELEAQSSATLQTAQQPPTVQAISPPTAQPAAAAAPDPASAASASPSPTLEQVQQIAADLAALKQAVEQLAGNQGQMTQDIAKVQAMDQEVLNKLSANKVAATNANNKVVATRVSAAPPQAAALTTHRHPPVSPAPPPPVAAAPAPPQPLPPQSVPPQPLPLR